jgi:hypothetical protein
VYWKERSDDGSGFRMASSEHGRMQRCDAIVRVGVGADDFLLVVVMV